MLDDFLIIFMIELLSRDMSKREGKKSTLLGRLSGEQLAKAMQLESKEFEKYYRWLEEHMPPALFEEVEQSYLMAIAHNLVSFHLQGNFIQIQFENCSIVLCLDSYDADVRILKHFSSVGIKNYQTFVSNAPLPSCTSQEKIRIALILFTQLVDCKRDNESVFDKEMKESVFYELHERNPTLTREKFEHVLASIDTRFLRLLNKERFMFAFEMFLKAETRDHIQYEIKYNEDWETSPKNLPSMQIVFAWKNTQKYNFLYRVAKLIYRHKLVMKRVSASYINPYTSDTILLMSLAIHGQDNIAAWEATDIQDFLKELATLKYFDDNDLIDQVFVSGKLLSGNYANLVRGFFVALSHQFLLHADPNLYSPTHIQEALCRHPELTILLTELFALKFDPIHHNFAEFERRKPHYLALVEKLDTGNLAIDTRRKNILSLSLRLIEYTDKTNFYRTNKSALAFRINPQVMEYFPYDRREKFPEIPFAIFFLYTKTFFGFHLRFKDLSRGGIRAVFPFREEQALWEKGNIFSECYNLAYTQQKKNKDIPEGGAKGVLFIESFEELRLETQIYKQELLKQGCQESEIRDRIQKFQHDQRLVFLYQSQRAYVHSILTLVNCEDSGQLKAQNVVDYYKKPEYLYFGPDENMHNVMIEWIAKFSKQVGYKVGSAFISSKPTYGINHKEFGVTSLGVNVYMHKTLEYLGIDPIKDSFTIKISGGPDGDVAGNQIYNLYRFYPKTAKLVALTDVSGTIYDPNGLDLSLLATLFKEEKPIRFYPAEHLTEGGFLLDLQTKKEESFYAPQTLLYKKEQGKLVKEWLDGNQTHYLFSHNLHSVYADIFIPGGGRPRTLNQSNWRDYLDPQGKPTSKAIVEGANLYLTSEARTALEERGVLIIKDSSANKCGVICSSLEVLSGLILSDEEFLKQKSLLMKEVLAFLEEKAANEADLLLRTHKETGRPLTEISDLISLKINTFTYELLDYLETIDLPTDPSNPLMQCLIHYCPELFQIKYKERILRNIPPIHQKAIISCYIAARLVYNRGLSWNPSIVDVLPLILHGLEQV